MAASVFHLTDTDALEVPFDPASGTRRARGESSLPAELAWQFAEINRHRLAALGVAVEPLYRGGFARLRLSSSSTIGSVPLICPVSGKDTYGIVVEPRFTWAGVGPAMATTGWRVVPSILDLPLVPRSARDIPAWVIATAVLHRVAGMLSSLNRRFDMTEATLASPRGRMQWTTYATRHLARARADRLPCRFADLGEDRDLTASIHYVLRKQLAAIEAERSAGPVVLELLAWCTDLLRHVEHVPARCPSPRDIGSWMRSPLVGDALRAGIEAIEWTVADRGLAGLSELSGLPWRLDMAVFYEAWVETIVSRVAMKSGGAVSVGRLGQTTVPLTWDPPYTGSQRSLIPDIIWQRQDHTIIVDAKYKHHWSELSGSRWSDVAEVIREHHRADLLQVLAYGNLPDSSAVTLVLAYPCSPDQWLALAERDANLHVARVATGRRLLRVVLTGVPLDPSLLDRVSDLLRRKLAAT